MLASELEIPVFVDCFTQFHSVHGYEGAILSKGHSSMISEIKHRLKGKPDAIFCSVGGGGLLNGVIDGCRYANWDDGTHGKGCCCLIINYCRPVPIVAVETHGAAAFYHTMSLNNPWGVSCSLPDGSRKTFNDEHHIVIAEVRITSKASSLAATSPSASVVKGGLQRAGSITCVRIPDEMAMHTTLMFAGKMLQTKGFQANSLLLRQRIISS